MESPTARNFTKLTMWYNSRLGASNKAKSVLLHSSKLGSVPLLTLAVQATLSRVIPTSQKIIQFRLRHDRV